MQRRDVLERIGASSAVAVGAAGVGSAAEFDGFGPANRIPPEEANYIATEIDGEMREFTFEEFEAHPDTRSLSEVDLTSDCCGGGCCYRCKDCCAECCAGDLCCWGVEDCSCSGC